jgi:hypothetical protein
MISHADFAFLSDRQVDHEGSVQDEIISDFPNYLLAAWPKSLLYLYPPPSGPTEGRHAIVTAAGRDAVDADGAKDEGT